mgnify:CR=1 FL=1|jgi:transcriptional regulator with XRE-family HTH domain
MLAIQFGKVLQDMRRNAHLSQEKLAELAGYDRTYISLLERGLRQPTITTLFNLAKALNVSASSFVKTIEDYEGLRHA